MIRRVSIVGPTAPPIGGISSHVGALAERLRGEGVAVGVFDYARVTAERPRLTRPWALSRSLFDAAWWARGHNALLHLHISAGRRFALIAPLVTAVESAVPVVLTVHSGSFAMAARESRGLRRRVMRSALGGAKRVIAVSEEIRLALIAECDVDPSSVVVIPAYVAQRERSAHQPSAKLRGSITASGYGIALYGWLELVRAARSSSMSQLNIVMYGEIDPAYLALVREAAADDARVKFHFDLERAAFAQLLAETHVFIRPTKADGDSIAVREALAAGCVVIASDAVRRPEGCVIFALDQEDAFARVVRNCLASDPQSQDHLRGEGADAFQLIMNVYRAAVR